MWKSTTTFLLCILTMISAAGSCRVAWAQQQRVQESLPQTAADRVKDGYYEITLRTPEASKMIVDELVRDRDLNAASLYRVRTGGYLAFDEGEWVDKIEFKIFDTPVTELPQYKRFAELLVEINSKIWDIKDVLGRYDQLALRLMNICERSRFTTLKSIDDNISQQLAIYRKLELLRTLVLNSLNRFVRDRSCRDMYSDYQKTLDLYSRQLSELSKNFDRLQRRAVTLAKEVTPSAAAATDQSNKPAPEQP